MQCPEKRVLRNNRMVFVNVELQQPVKGILLWMSVMLQTTSANVARWIHVFHQKRVLLEPALVINYLYFF